ncbi:MAG: DUF4097 family beta strand repeat protein [Clostridia bacterium]|nr:DUF4097 family beta strand repeat protein [Clostridia bacterium]
MMNKRIRSMIDEIFSEMKMTADNLALRDELMANALSRYEDSIAQGMSEEKAFAEVAQSLDDVQGLLEEMNRMDAQPKAEPAEETIPELKTGVRPQEEAAEEMEADEKEKTEETEQKEECAEDAALQTDLGDALNKAFGALGDFTQSIMPEAKKLVRQMDDATGGVLRGLGKAAKKGLRDAQKAAEEAIDRLDQGTLVFDFGPKTKPEDKAQEPAQQTAGEPEQQAEEKPEQAQEPAELVFDFPQEEARREAAQGELILDLPQQEPEKAEKTKTAESEAAALYEQAKDLRAQALLKDVTGDSENADALRLEADALEAKAQFLMQAPAEEETEEGKEEACGVQPKEEKPEEMPAQDETGELDEAAFARTVDELAQEAEDAIRQAKAVISEAAEEIVHEAEYIVRGADEPVGGMKTFPAAGLRTVDIKLDADDVEILAAQGSEIETVWEAKNVDGEPVFELSDHKLIIRRKNPDVFKTFFSVIQKNGGKVIVRIPRGYAADYQISTTSGDVRVCGVDADDVKVTTTSGDVRIEPDARVRLQNVEVTTVSGCATVSACADDVKVTTVSGHQFISCDAHKVDVNVVSGRVHVEGACDEWEVNSVSSEVELLCTVVPAKKIEIGSMHGSVRLALPGDIRGFVAEVSGPLGCEIVNEFGPNRYGTCALPIRMETMRGKLMITRL